MKKYNFLILTGDGINCENETQLALETAGLIGTRRHINELMAHPEDLLEYDGLALAGGFSFGDELGSGQVLAMKLKYGLGNFLEAFVARRSPIIGICNGFQVLVKLGLLPDFSRERGVALAENLNGSFIDKWVSLKVHNDSICVWTREFEGESIELPIRHKEGRLICSDESIIETLRENRQVVMTYQDNLNGSDYSIAGLCDPSGTILGLMPHPEAAVFKATSHAPREGLAKADGFKLFDAIKCYLEQR